MTAYSVTLKTRTALPKTGYAWVPIDSTADTALAAITTSSTVADVLTVLNACIARKLVTDANTIGLATNAPANIDDGIGSIRDLVTSAAFTASQTGAAVTLSQGHGTGATATVNTDGDGNVTAVTITDPGAGYRLGDVIYVDEDAATGVAAFIVASFG